MAGLPRYSINQNEHFERTFKKLAKTYKSKREKLSLVSNVETYLKKLQDDPYPKESSQEPLPSKMQLLGNCFVCKLRWKYKSGASGQLRLIYVVNENTKSVTPLWIYSHQQYAKRPPDKELKTLLSEFWQENQNTDDN